MNKDIIKISIIVILVLIIILSMVLVILNLNTEEEESSSEELNYIEQGAIDDEVTFEDQLDTYDFLIASNCVSSYLSGINKNNSSFYGYDENDDYTLVVSEEQIYQTVYNFLDKEYIQENSITLNNVYDYVLDVNEFLMFVPLDMKAQKGDGINTYAIYGYTIDLEYNMQDYIYVIINIDENNQAFSVKEINEEVYNQDLVNNQLEIEANDNNTINTLQLTETYRIRHYFTNFKFMLLSNPDIAYEFLNETYRTIKFGSLDNFKEYVSNNRSQILVSTLEEYDSTVYDEITEYVEKDQNNRYYIFTIDDTDASNYNVMLDTYVLGTIEIQRDYSSGSDEKKVNINTMRFISAINEQDYTYAYNILADSFKQNNFVTQLEFEEYIQENLFEYNSVSNYSFGQEGNYYTYSLTITGSSGETKQMVVIMQLLDELEFEMSFSIE